MLAIRRYLVLVVVLVAMGLCTVWWKTRTLQMGYEAVRLEQANSRVEEEERIEDSRLTGMTDPAEVIRVSRELGLGLDRQETAPRNRLAAGGMGQGGQQPWREGGAVRQERDRR